MSPSKAEIAERRGPDVRRWFGMSETGRVLTSAEPVAPPATIDRICERLVEGDSLSKICQVAEMPSVSTVMLWQRADPLIREAFAAARSARAELQWDACREEVESILRHAAAVGDKSTLMAAQAEAKLKFDYYKFEVTKLLPGIYGDAGDKRLMLERAEMRANGARAANGEVVREIIEVPVKELPMPRKGRSDDK